jgi:hypothetical protein
VSAGRNEPCPCGSGAKYKRCCLNRELEVERLVSGLESAVEDLAADTWARDEDWCRTQFAEFYDGGLDAFGLLGPTDRELLEAHLWFLLDCPLATGETPLWRAQQEATGRAIELLSRSELRAWSVDAVLGPRLVSAVCPLGTGCARLELAREPAGELAPGAMLVARSVPLGPERWALLGAVPVVDPLVTEEFEQLLTSLDAPRAEIWRVHGGVLARAAWAWPEEREHTIDGELVTDTSVAYALLDVDAALRSLDSDPELDRGAEHQPFDALRWRWRWDPPAGRELEAERGVRVELCREDADARPYLADVEVTEDAELWLTAPTPRRLALARRLLADRLGPLLGPIVTVHSDPPEITPRWKRRRLEAMFHRMAPGLRRARSAA